MQSLLDGDRRYQLLARFHDYLGWDNFVEGRLCKLWLECRKVDIARLGLWSTAESWATKLSRRLLGLTHRQWIYRNSIVHYKVEVEGLTIPQHQKIMEEVETLTDQDPEDLLPEDQHWLDVDFAALGGGTVADRCLWAAEVQRWPRPNTLPVV